VHFFFVVMNVLLDCTPGKEASYAAVEQHTDRHAEERWGLCGHAGGSPVRDSFNTHTILIFPLSIGFDLVAVSIDLQCLCSMGSWQRMGGENLYRHKKYCII